MGFLPVFPDPVPTSGLILSLHGRVAILIPVGKPADDAALLNRDFG